MKAFAIALVALVVVASVSYVVLGEFTEPVSQRYASEGSVRLDEGQRSDGRFPE